MISYLERLALSKIEEAGLPEPIREYTFGKGKWYLDFFWLTPTSRVILSIDYGKNKDGKFIDSIKYSQDMESLNEAVLRGYKVIRVTKTHMINGQMVEWLKRAL